MQQHDIFLVKYSIEKSEKALETGFKNLEIDLQVSQNRAYYAVFYIVLALGYLDGFKTGKHHQLMGYFNKKYIYEKKIFKPELSDIYSQLISNREKFDYNVSFKLSEESVIDNLNKAKVFIDIVKPYILSRIPKIIDDM